MLVGNPTRGAGQWHHCGGIEERERVAGGVMGAHCLSHWPHCACLCHTLPHCLCDTARLLVSHCKSHVTIHTLPHCLCDTAPSPINLCGPSLIPNSSFAFKFSEETTRSCSIGNWSRTKKHQLKTLQECKTALTKLWTLFGHGLKSVWKNLKSLSVLKC